MADYLASIFGTEKDKVNCSEGQCVLNLVLQHVEACCRQYEMGECTRSGFCNFMHLKPISRELRRYLYSRRKGGRAGTHIDGGRPRTRSRSPKRARFRSRERNGSRSSKHRSGRSGRY